MKYEATTNEMALYTTDAVMETVLDLTDVELENYIDDSRYIISIISTSDLIGGKARVGVRFLSLIMLLSTVSLKFSSNHSGILIASIWISAVFILVFLWVVIESDTISTIANMPMSRKSEDRTDCEFVIAKLKPAVMLTENLLGLSCYATVIATLLFCIGVTVD
jgi:hypothetical protein